MNDTEMTRFLAEKCMGWEVVVRDSARHEDIILMDTLELTNACMFIDGRLCKWTETRPGYIELVAFSPLENIVDAFQVVGKMREKGFSIEIEAGNKQPEWFVCMGLLNDWRSGDTPSRAICLGCIAALEGK